MYDFTHTHGKLSTRHTLRRYLNLRSWRRAVIITALYETI